MMPSIWISSSKQKKPPWPWRKSVYHVSWALPKRWKPVDNEGWKRVPFIQMNRFHLPTVNQGLGNSQHVSLYPFPDLESKAQLPMPAVMVTALAKLRSPMVLPWRPTIQQTSETAIQRCMSHRHDKKNTENTDTLVIWDFDRFCTSWGGKNSFPLLDFFKRTDLY